MLEKSVRFFHGGHNVNSYSLQNLNNIYDLCSSPLDVIDQLWNLHFVLTRMCFYCSKWKVVRIKLHPVAAILQTWAVDRKLGNLFRNQRTITQQTMSIEGLTSLSIEGLTVLPIPKTNSTAISKQLTIRKTEITRKIQTITQTTAPETEIRSSSEVAYNWTLDPVTSGNHNLEKTRHLPSGK